MEQLAAIGGDGAESVLGDVDEARALEAADDFAVGLPAVDLPGVGLRLRPRGLPGADAFLAHNGLAGAGGDEGVTDAEADLDWIRSDLVDADDLELSGVDGLQGSEPGLDGLEEAVGTGSDVGGEAVSGCRDGVWRGSGVGSWDGCESRGLERGIKQA